MKAGERKWSEPQAAELRRANGASAMEPSKPRVNGPYEGKEKLMERGLRAQVKASGEIPMPASTGNPS